MADNYGNGSYNSGDFKRNSAQGDAENGPRDQGVKLNEKTDEYLRELLAEKIKLNNAKFPFSLKLIDAEVTRVQTTGRGPSKDSKYIDVLREKPTKVTAKVLVPIKEHPSYNFVGKLLGPKGSTMKQLQEETMCKMAILGRGSMRDRQKEQELRTSLDPKYAHLSDELHVEISALAPPGEAYARIAYALSEIKKHLIPEPGPEMMWPPVDRDGRPAGPPPGRMGGGRGPPRMQAPPPRAPPTKGKALSILDRARSVMDAPYGYEDSYGPPEPPMRGPPRAPEPDYYYNDRAPERFYDDDSYSYKEEHRDYKTATAREVGTRRPAPPPSRQQPFTRPQPYSRPQNQRGRPNKGPGGKPGWN